MGYIPAYGLGLVLYSFAAGATKLSVIMTTARALMVLILTIIMCLGSGAIAVNKLRSADPADIF